ncbi:MAG TPA: hypothetical protein VFR41_14595 [Acidimicrobiia bacterium]|nr:hypothetical protein [Acidimicrobiia bacterium]
MTLVMVMLASGTGCAAYWEAAKYVRRFGKAPWGLPPLACGVFCLAIGLVVSLISPPFVLALLAAFVGYTEMLDFERRQQDGFWGLPARFWGVVCFFIGFTGALVVSALAWGVVCGFLAFSGALYLVTSEKNALLVERDALKSEYINALSENRKLQDERNARAAKPVASAAPTAAAGGKATTKHSLLFAVPQAPNASVPAAVPAPVGDLDLLPRRR